MDQRQVAQVPGVVGKMPGVVQEQSGHARQRRAGHSVVGQRGEAGAGLQRQGHFTASAV
jgi:hypothetical protein